MKALQGNGYKVTFVPQDNFLWTKEFSSPLQRDGIEMIYHPFYSRFRPFIEARGGEFDLIFIHRFQTAERVVADLRRHAPQAKIVMLNADLHYLREQREAELLNDEAKLAVAEQTKRRELNVMGTVDLVLAHSTVEIDILGKSLGAQCVHHLPLIHDPEPTPASFSQRSGIGFLGGYGHPPNVDAVDWFVAKIWPLVRAECPEATFLIAGSKMPKRFKSLHGKRGIEVLGFIESLPDYFNSIRLSIAPLRFGAGAKGKVAASLAMGIPCVATDIAAEGMGLDAGQNILIGDSAEAFAAHVAKLYQDEAGWGALRSAGLAFAETSTSRKVVRNRIESMLKRLSLR